jgi:UDP-N-acetylmuramoylalanine--D-glutamate ligase
MEKGINPKSKIAILGMGLEGQALAKYFKKHKYKNVTLCDEKKDLKGCDKTGKDAFKNLDQFEYIFRSPGIHKDHPEITKARKKNVKITSATKLFFDLCPCPIIGITGTKGKGTTSTLIYEILKEAGKDVHLGGNIGTPAMEFIDKLKEDSLIILELSSFQLHDLKKSPHIAVVLNTTSEHLNYHKDTEEYLTAKESIVKYQTKKDVVVGNYDYPYHLRFLALTPAKKLLVSRNEAVKNGAYIDKNNIVYIKNGKKETLCKTNKVGLIGPHNLENILPAITVCAQMKIPQKTIIKVIKEFKGLPHRLEFIRRIDDVDYYNDSFSTTPETCIAAIQSFSKPLVLIAGGSEKKSDYTDLGRAIVRQRNLETVILMGKTADQIEKSIQSANDEAKKLEKQGKPYKFRDVQLNIVRAKTYGEAFFAARLHAVKDGAIVLSPASASFDMFENYKYRGETFRKWVESL